MTIVMIQVVTSKLLLDTTNSNLGRNGKVMVCGFETSIKERLKLKVEGCTDARGKKKVCCSNPGCEMLNICILALKNKQFIFSVPAVVGKICFNTAHYDIFKWIIADSTILGQDEKRQLAGVHRIYNNI